MAYFAGPQGRRALLFLNNPHGSQYTDATGMGLHYDIVTDPDPDGYSVQITRVHIDDGDVAVVYRVARGAVRRVPGHIVAIAQITSSPWVNRNDYASINWNVRLLPPEDWISSADMQASGHWQNRVPFSTNTQASSPVELDAARWGWLEQRLPNGAKKWLSDHARG